MFSGSVDVGEPLRLQCDMCKSSMNYDYLYHYGRNYCYKCCNFSKKKARFKTKREIIEKFLRKHLSFTEKTPVGVLADLFEEKGLTSLSDYLRSEE